MRIQSPGTSGLVLQQPDVHHALDALDADHRQVLAVASSIWIIPTPTPRVVYPGRAMPRQGTCRRPALASAVRVRDVLAASTLTIARSRGLRGSTISPGIPGTCRTSPHLAVRSARPLHRARRRRTPRDHQQGLASCPPSEQVADQVDDRLRGPVDDRGHRLGRARSPRRRTRARSPTTSTRSTGRSTPTPRARPSSIPSRAPGSMPCASNRAASSRLRRRPVQVVFEQVERAGRRGRRRTVSTRTSAR